VTQSLTPPSGPEGLHEDLEAPGLEGAATSADYEMTLKSLSQWELVWRRFRKHRLALVGLGILGFLILVAIVGPFILPYTPNPKLSPDQFLHLGHSPSLTHPFGETGSLQADVLMLVVNGARTSLFLGFTSMAIGVVLGAIVGAVAGYVGGFLDNILMRFVDVMLSLPLLFVILVVARFFKDSSDNMWSIIIVFGLFSWMGVSRLVRSLFLSIREREFVEAARAVGVRDRRIIFKHILPNALSPIIVAASLIVAGNITGEAFISFLGFGINPATPPTWSNVLSSSLASVLEGNWWWPLFPGLAIILAVLAVNFVGDGLRDAFDPRSRA
jgi:peptide/nickel transport system permease protein